MVGWSGRRAYQRDEARVEQQLRILHAHRHDGQPLMGSVVRRQLGAADQGGGLHEAVHVDRKHLHGVGQDQLRTKTKPSVTHFKPDEFCVAGEAGADLAGG